MFSCVFFLFFLFCLVVYRLIVESLSLHSPTNKSNKNDQRQQCAGIYSKQDWGGSKDSFIDLALKPESSNDDGWIAIVIYEYRNVEMLGIKTSNANNKKYICDDAAVESQLCDKDQIGTFIVDEESGKPYASIVTKKIDLKDPEAVNYPIQKSGYYCVSTYPSSSNIKYNGVVVYQNAFGNLPASQIPKLPFFGGAALAYFLVLLFWMFLYIQHRSDILPVQNYITAICGFLVIEMIIIWGYYEFANIHGSTVGSKVYLVILSVLNSIRNAYTFFLLLIVCLGYGVVKPTLGNVMWKCQVLGGAHFVFAILYTIGSYSISPDRVGAVALLLVVPMSVTMTVFYVWILSSLTNTIKYLDERKQAVKANMYKNLWRILLGSIVVIFAFFFINSLLFAQESTLEFITRHWQSRWFMLDGWLNVVYFADFCMIAFIWRPTANNRRFAMSSQLAQDENEAEEFEIGSLRESLDDEENNVVRPSEIPMFSPPAYSGDENDEDVSPISSSINISSQKAKPTSSAADTSSTVVRGSSSVQDNDAQTMFAVGDDEADDKYEQWDEDDVLSEDEDEDNADESKGLRRKKTST